MIAILPPYRPGMPIGMIRAGLMLVLMLALWVMKIQIDHRLREMTAREFDSSRQIILSRIDSAVERRDLDSLLDIDHKYTGCVADKTYRQSITEALAKVQAQEATRQLAAARRLGIERHGEELSVRPNLLKPQVSNDRFEQPRLSVLPR